MTGQPAYSIYPCTFPTLHLSSSPWNKTVRLRNKSNQMNMCHALFVSYFSFLFSLPKKILERTIILTKQAGLIGSQMCALALRKTWNLRKAKGRRIDRKEKNLLGVLPMAPLALPDCRGRTCCCLLLLRGFSCPLPGLSVGLSA